MKIGDKVRFLSETGGGKIAGFKGNNIVLVEDEDGFQIPTPINEVVVVNDEDYSTKRIVETKLGSKPDKQNLTHDGRSIKAMMHDGQDEVVDMTQTDDVDLSKDVTYRPKAEERKGGNVLNVFLAFVPEDPKQLTNPHFESYLVNDSNYYLRFAIAKMEGNSLTLSHEDEIEPNTKLFLSDIFREDINSLDRLAVQLFAYKRQQSYVRKEAIDVTLRIDPVKFFKIHTFTDSDFFDTPALLYPIVENDMPVRPLVVDTKTLKREMYAAAEDNSTLTGTSSDSRRSTLVKRYADDQRKGGRKSLHGQYRGLDDAVVVDLHAEQLLDTTAGMKPGEILNYQLKVFRETLDKYANKKGQKLIFIHGKGEGVLRQALVHELRYKYKSYTYQDASFQEYGYGATQVTIR
ncbi:MAG: DUF2027 domain-containing protein [Prevotella sp.]|jgi:hypothetical protein